MLPRLAAGKSADAAVTGRSDKDRSEESRWPIWCCAMAVCPPVAESIFMSTTDGSKAQAGLGFGNGGDHDEQAWVRTEKGHQFEIWRPKIM